MNIRIVNWTPARRSRTIEIFLKRPAFDPEASILVQLFAELERGEATSYGGAVLGVLSALEGAAAEPDERSENLRNALRGANAFMAHMRTVSISRLTSRLHARIFASSGLPVRATSAANEALPRGRPDSQ